MYRAEVVQEDHSLPLEGVIVGREMSIDLPFENHVRASLQEFQYIAFHKKESARA